MRAMHRTADTLKCLYLCLALHTEIILFFSFFNIDKPQNLSQYYH